MNVKRQKMILELILAFLSGVALGYGLIQVNFWFWLGMMVLMLLFLNRWGGFISRGVDWKGGILLILFVCFGILRAGMDVSFEEGLFFLEKEKVTVEGEVYNIMPLDKWKNEVRLTAQSIWIAGREIKIAAKIRVVLERTNNLKWGQQVKISGLIDSRDVLKENPFWDYLFKERFDYLLNAPKMERGDIGRAGGAGWRDWWWNAWWNGLNDFRGGINDFFRRELSENTAALMIGILVGQRADFPKEVLNDFAKTGLSHVLAISGFNIALIIGILEKLLEKRVGKKSRLILIGLLILLFSVFTGSSASVIRAAIMGMTALLVKYSGRPNQAVLVLMMTIFIMVMINPRILNFDVGFQLSFLATLGLLLFMPLLEKGWKFLPGDLSEIFYSTVAALSLTLPILMIDFGFISLITFLANLVVLPMIPFLMLAGTVLWICGLIAPILVMVLAAPLSFLTELLILVVSQMAEWGGGILMIKFDSAGAGIWLFYYLALFMLFGRPEWARSFFWDHGVLHKEAAIPESEKRKK